MKEYLKMFGIVERSFYKGLTTIREIGLPIIWENEEIDVAEWRSIMDSSK